MENKKTGQQLPPTHAGDGGEAMEKTEITQFPTALKKLKNPKMQDGMSQWYESTAKSE